jgi:putative SOS response-associated peptidase YedK
MYSWRELVEAYNLFLYGSIPNFQPRYNICPTTTIDAVVERDGKRMLEQMRWGLVPSWWSKPLKELKLATFNARVETVTTKPFFRSAFKRNRCLLPASGYYEWHTVGKEKQPYYFTRRDGAVMTLAGLWDEWRNPETNELLHSCTMIIGEPNRFVAEVHDRMPIVLEPAQFGPWLTGQAGLEILKSTAEEVLDKHPVSKRVNSSRASDEDVTLIKRFEYYCEARRTAKT